MPPFWTTVQAIGRSSDCWDRGRPARNERASASRPQQRIKPVWIVCRRDARGPSKSLESSGSAVDEVFDDVLP